REPRAARVRRHLAGPLRPPGGGRRRGAVPRGRGVELHHRLGDHRRRRLPGPQVLLMSQILPDDFVAKAFSLEGRVAAVAGGASGLGAAMGAGLAQAGAAVAVLDVDTERAEQVAEAIVASGGEAF